ncbi:hypothetical protein D6C90_07450 [Aureobasidium pullulans]|uniref:Uncharacterized protein n=1 Tax=Aureobasidium pullulans TaxID=5580 RepID=A0A4S9UCL1_AURPU|nr:hypothetical protein D6C90_07450 [Aureobasidium pullulans]
MVGRIDPISNDYVPGGEYCDVPGTNLDSGCWALAMGMANEMQCRQRIKALPDGIVGRYFVILKSIYEGITWLPKHPHTPPPGSHLSDIIDSWNDRYRDKYRLFQDVGRQITPLTKELNPKQQTVLVRCVNDRWQPCGYFEKPETIIAPLPKPVVTARRIEAGPTLLKPQPVPQLQVHASTVSGDQNNVDDSEKTANKILKTAASIETTATELHTTSAKLVPAIEKLTEALEKYGQREEDLQTAIEKLTAAVEEATQSRLWMD